MPEIEFLVKGTNLLRTLKNKGLYLCRPEIIENENIFVMTEKRAARQDIRPLKIAIVNLMPEKIKTETQLLRLLSNSPLQVEVELIQMDSHVSKNTSTEHLSAFYKTSFFPFFWCVLLFVFI